MAALTGTGTALAAGWNYNGLSSSHTSGMPGQNFRPPHGMHANQASSQALTATGIDTALQDARLTGLLLLPNRNIKEMPPNASAFQLGDTLEADLSRNGLSEVPEEVCEFLCLEKLNCQANSIKAVPETVINLQLLTELNLRRNMLTTLPPLLCQLPLQILLLSSNKLVSLPEEIAGLANTLMQLDVSCNEISQLPAQIGDLQNLRVLNVSKNLLQELTPDVSKLKLTRLDISCNKISQLPPTLRLMTTLLQLNVDHNPLTLPPASECRRGRVHIFKCLERAAMKEDKRRNAAFLENHNLHRKTLCQQQAANEEVSRYMRELAADKRSGKGNSLSVADSGYTTDTGPTDKRWSNESNQDLNTDSPDDAGKMAVRAAQQTKEQRLRRRASQGEVEPVMEVATNQNGSAHVMSNGPVSVVAGLEDEFTKELARQKAVYEEKKRQAERIRLESELQQQEQQRQQHRRNNNNRNEQQQRAAAEAKTNNNNNNQLNLDLQQQAPPPCSTPKQQHKQKFEWRINSQLNGSVQLPSLADMLYTPSQEVNGNSSTRGAPTTWTNNNNTLPRMSPTVQQISPIFRGTQLQPAATTSIKQGVEGFNRQQPVQQRSHRQPSQQNSQQPQRHQQEPSPHSCQQPSQHRQQQRSQLNNQQQAQQQSQHNQQQAQHNQQQAQHNQQQAQHNQQQAQHNQQQAQHNNHQRLQQSQANTTASPPQLVKPSVIRIIPIEREASPPLPSPPPPLPSAVASMSPSKKGAPPPPLQRVSSLSPHGVGPPSPHSVSPHSPYGSEYSPNFIPPSSNHVAPYSATQMMPQSLQHAPPSSPHHTSQPSPLGAPQAPHYTSQPSPHGTPKSPHRTSQQSPHGTPQTPHYTSQPSPHSTPKLPHHTSQPHGTLQSLHRTSQSPHPASQSSHRTSQPSPHGTPQSPHRTSQPSPHGTLQSPHCAPVSSLHSPQRSPQGAPPLSHGAPHTSHCAPHTPSPVLSHQDLSKDQSPHEIPTSQRSGLTQPHATNVSQPKNSKQRLSQQPVADAQLKVQQRSTAGQSTNLQPISTIVQQSNATQVVSKQQPPPHATPSVLSLQQPTTAPQQLAVSTALPMQQLATASPKQLATPATATNANKQAAQSSIKKQLNVTTQGNKSTIATKLDRQQSSNVVVSTNTSIQQPSTNSVQPQVGTAQPLQPKQARLANGAPRQLLQPSVNGAVSTQSARGNATAQGQITGGGSGAKMNGKVGGSVDNSSAASRLAKKGIPQRTSSLPQQQLSARHGTQQNTRNGHVTTGIPAPRSATPSLTTARSASTTTKMAASATSTLPRTSGKAAGGGGLASSNSRLNGSTQSLAGGRTTGAAANLRRNGGLASSRQSLTRASNSSLASSRASSTLSCTEEEHQEKHKSMQQTRQREALHARKRVELAERTRQVQKQAVMTYVSKRSPQSAATTTPQQQGKAKGTPAMVTPLQNGHAPNATELNLTVRRQLSSVDNENALAAQLRKTIENRLKVKLPENLPLALHDGVVLCHFVNNIKPRSVPTIHVPSAAVPKLTVAKCRRNVENFLEACRKLGISQEMLSPTDIVECKNVAALALTVQALAVKHAPSFARQTARKQTTI